MIQRPEEHLNSDELLQSLAQTADPQARRQAHLNACPHCQETLASLEKCFERVGQTARDLSPAPARPFRLPQKQRFSSRWFAKPLIATGLVAVCLLGLAVWLPNPYWPENPPVKVTAADYEADRQLMEEVNALVENALPPAYQQLVAASDVNLDEDLINWLVPSIEEDDDSLL